MAKAIKNKRFPIVDHPPCKKCGLYPRLKEFMSFVGVQRFLATGICEECE